ncbi:hypothetical protein TNCV_2892681 [Trichonephila clavipes]|nr:hypothetical protein TNCV_2892681 [Trichonephila clavipes]
MERQCTIETYFDLAFNGKMIHLTDEGDDYTDQMNNNSDFPIRTLEAGNTVNEDRYHSERKVFPLRVPDERLSNLMAVGEKEMIGSGCPITTSNLSAWANHDHERHTLGPRKSID